MGQPVAAQKAPYAVTLVAGKTYYWCACGRSAKQPFCDGAHKETGISPLAFKAETDGEAWLCGCKATAGSPFCDGSHNSL